MKIHIKRAWGENFLSIGSVPMEYILDDHATTIISGVNGSGKSTLIDILFFAFYGKSFRKVNKDKMVNNINKKKTMVGVDFTVGSNEYTVTRGIKPNHFEIVQNGRALDKDDTRDDQKYLTNQVLQMDETAFRQIVVLGSRTYTPFMRLSLPERRTLVEAMLDIGIFGDMNNIAKKRLTEVNNNLKSVEQLMSTKEQMGKQTRQHIAAVEEKESADTAADELEIAALRAKIEPLLDEVRKIDEEIREFGADAIQNELNAALKEKYRLDGIIRVGEDKADRARKDLSFYETNSNCPRCGQEITEETLEAHRAEAMVLVKEGKKEAEIAAQERTAVEKRMSELSKKLEGAKPLDDRRLIAASAISNNSFQISVLEGKIAKAKNTESSLKARMLDDLNKLRAEYSELAKKKKLLIDEIEDYTVAVNLTKDDGIKAEIIKAFLPLINSKMNKYLSLIGFPIMFRFDEQFNETMLTGGRTPLEYGQMSEGEKMRFDLCMLFTWREVAKARASCWSNLLILDEVADSSLDYDGWESFIQILQSEEGSNVVMISHKPEIFTDRFDRHIKIRKIGKFTKIETEGS